MVAIEAGGENGNIISPRRIVTHWKRFACGLWRLPEGDISAAYCADIFPKLKVFTHDGCLFTNCGSLFSTAIHSIVNAYPLIAPDEYRGPEKVQYSYEGKEGIYKKERWRLGPKANFESDDPTIEEWISILRVLYADGGMFAHGVTYREYLSDRHRPKTRNEHEAHAAELYLCDSAAMPETQAEMKSFIEKAFSPLPQTQPQLELVF